MRPSVVVILAFALASSAVPISPDVAVTKRADGVAQHGLKSISIRLPSKADVLPIWKRHDEHDHNESNGEGKQTHRMILVWTTNDDDESDGPDEDKGDKTPEPKPDSGSKPVPNPFPKDDGHPKVTPLPGGEPSGQPHDGDDKKPDPLPQDDGDKEPNQEPEGDGDKEPEQQGGSNEPEPQPSGGSGNPTADAYVQPHNAARARHNANPVGWDDNLAAMAQKWVNGCDFKHSGGSLATSPGTSDSYNAGDAVQGWVDEEKDYDPNDPEAHGVGHFTQVVWKSTTTIGCAVADCPAGTGPFDGKGTWRYHSCVYSPAGNFVGKYKENVE
ncbi:CAP domain-containing protein [Auriculariales sp. MPI-PUGE-AT-0066]|nr:CAP domain-containing protein [Auriculariales sp. MPI-PUGE-AT-0066]